MAEPDGGFDDAFEPANDLERVLVRAVFSGSRATLLRALARSSLVLRAELPGEAGLTSADAGCVQVPCLADGEGRHALLYTSYRQMALAHRLADRAQVRWYEVTVAQLFERWPKGVDIWLNAGGQLGFPLDLADIATVGDIAAGLEVDEAYEIGPDDEFTDFPGPSIPDQVDCAIVLSLSEVPEVLEVVRSFRRLEEPAGRTWRIVMVLVDQDVHGQVMAQNLVGAINEASDECCEVHVADVHDDEVYDAIKHLLHIGVPLWRRDGLAAPDTAETLAGIDVTGLETGGVPDSPARLGRDLEPGSEPPLGPGQPGAAGGPEPGNRPDPIP
ncbi:MAG: SseB family protein [Actinobacteria bacterium]|nr:SseB family protein [Actinomycetota bacterium]